jgi:hypothetical protein
MLIGGVIQHEVQDDADVPFVGCGEEGFEVVQCAVFRGDVAVVRDVVAAVPVWGGEMRREPNGVHAEVFEVVEFFGDALEVADAVAVPIGKGARVDLVEDCGLPPLEGCHSSKVLEFV